MFLNVECSQLILSFSVNGRDVLKPRQVDLELGPVEVSKLATGGVLEHLIAEPAHEFYDYHFIMILFIQPQSGSGVFSQVVQWNSLCVPMVPIGRFS